VGLGRKRCWVSSVVAQVELCVELVRQDPHGVMRNHPQDAFFGVSAIGITGSVDRNRGIPVPF